MHTPRLDWDDVQERANAILAEGIFTLRTSPFRLARDGSSAGPGNYLISLNGIPYYIGEASNLSARLKQQFNPKTTTFYKNYLKSQAVDRADISDFHAQHMTTHMGRKEIEDFGIANIPTRLNRFQLNKRPIHAPALDGALWHSVQEQCQELITQGEERLWSRQKSHMLEADVPERPGLYVVWNDRSDQIIYIGESSDLRARHDVHCKHTYFSALRRNVGTTLLGFELQEIKGRRRYFAEHEDRMVTDYLRHSTYQFMPVSLGRLELEEFLIRKYRSALNRKGNVVSPAGS